MADFVDYNGNDVNILTEDRISDNIILNSSFQVWDYPTKTVTGINPNAILCANGWFCIGTATNANNGISFKSLSTQTNSISEYIRIDRDLLINKTLSFSISINDKIYSVTGKLQKYDDELTSSDYVIYKMISGTPQDKIKSGIIAYFDGDVFIIRYFNDYKSATNTLNWMKLEISDKPTKYIPDPIKDMLSHNFVINIGAWQNCFSLRGDVYLYYIQIPYNNILGAKTVEILGTQSIELMGYRPSLETNVTIDDSSFNSTKIYNNYIEIIHNKQTGRIKAGNAIFMDDLYLYVY